MFHQTSNGIFGDSVGPNETIIPPMEREFNSLSNHGSLKANYFLKVRLIKAHSGILTFSERQKSSFRV